MLLLNGAVDGLLLPFDCVKLRSADDPALSLGFDFAKTSAKCMKKPVPCYGIPSLACVLLQRIAGVADSGRRDELLAKWEACVDCKNSCRDL